MRWASPITTETQTCCHDLLVGTLDRWTKDQFAADGTMHALWRRGSGPGVIVIHELPGMTPEVIDFADVLSILAVNFRPVDILA